MSRRLLAVTAAILLAVLGTVAIWAYVRGADARAVEGQKTVTVYVAEKTIPAGTTAERALADGMLVEKHIAKAGVPDNYLSDIKGGTAKYVAASDIAAGEIVLIPRFAAEVRTTGALSIPAGKVAMSVELTDPARVGTFLQAGADIAIFDTFNVQERDKADTTPAGDHISDRHEYNRATRVLLPKVRVLAVGATTTKPGSDESGKKAGTAQAAAATTTTLVTVAVSQAEAEKLVHGIQTGTLYLALVNDESNVKVGPGVDDRSLFSK